MRLDAKTLHDLGESLDKHHVPVESRTMLCIIDGIHYRLDESGCWCFAEAPNDDMGWTRCTPPVALQDLFESRQPAQAH